ncbi:MAG: PAS domain S-box protein, partial [Ignavibacteriaceae bacterium]|nr:PAS domain S-box protein [Ignavibacteriaceae bacterium]
SSLPKKDLLNVLEEQRITLEALKRSEEQNKKINHELAAINLFSRKVSESLSIKEVIAAALEGITETVKADISFIFLKEGDKLIQKEIDTEDSKILLKDIPDHKVGECLCGLAVEKKVPIYSKNIMDDVRCTWYECKKAGLKSFAALPLFSGEDVIGVLSLSSKDERDFESESQFLEILSKTLSIGLSNALLFTKTKKIEASLKENEERYRHISSVASDYMFSTKVTDDNLVPLNWVAGAFENITGYTFDEYIAIGGWRATLHPDDIEIDNHDMEMLRKNQKVVTEIRTFAKNGSIVWVRSYAHPVWNEDEQRLVGIFGAVQDITARKHSEQELKQREYLFRSMNNNSPLGMHFYELQNDKLIFAGANPAADKLLGIDNSQFIGLSIEEAFPPLIETEVPDRYKDAAAKGILWTTDQISYNDGKISGAFEVRAFQTTQGKMVALFMDVTERKKTEQALLDSEERWQFALEGAGDGVWDWNVPESKVLFSHQWKKQLGYNNDEIGNTLKDWESKVHPEDLDYVYNEINKHFNGETPVYQSEYRILCKDGTYKWILDRGKVVSKFANGKPQRFIGTHTDITSRKIMETMLRENEERLKMLFNTSIEGICLTDVDENIILVNPRMEEMLEYKGGELLGINFISLVSSDETDDQIKMIKNRKLGKAEVYERQLIKKSGAPFWVLISGSPVKNSEGKYNGSFGMLVDITERKNMMEELVGAKDKAEASDRIKSEFLAQMSHEIRTPLNVITSNISLLQEEIEDVINDDLRQLFNAIGRSTRRIIRTVDLILNISELQAGSFELSYKRLFISSDVLLPLISEHKNLLKNKSLEFIYNNLCVDDKVVVDEYCITQIFANLIDNAIKYTKAGSIEVKLYNNEQGNVTAEIIDTGIGISKYFLDHLFEPFVQEEQGYTRSYEGNGLGLTLVKKYCELNDVILEVESEKGVGSTFRVIFSDNKLR